MRTCRPSADEDELVRTYIPLVHYAVAEISTKIPRHVLRDDLVSAGMAGLAQAARSFDPDRGVSFQRFASARIRGALLDELRSRDWASRSVRAKARKLSVASERLTAKLGRTPSVEELAGAMGVAGTAVAAITDDVHRAVVLNFDALPIEGNAEEVVLSGEGTPDDLLLEQERRAYLVAAVANLPDRLRRVVVGYFFENLPMQVLADELGVTDSRISQMRAEALHLLRDGINSQLDPDLVDGQPVSSPVAKRRASYYGAIASHHDFRTRLSPEAASLASLSEVAQPA
jgi:RNA polymerase sigma factor for flagellar operon FliA